VSRFPDITNINTTPLKRRQPPGILGISSEYCLKRQTRRIRSVAVWLFPLLQKAVQKSPEGDRKGRPGEVFKQQG
jgi:hypothetical protein